MSNKIGGGFKIVVKAVHIADGRPGQLLRVDVVQRRHTHHDADAVRAAAKKFDAAMTAEMMNAAGAVESQVFLARKKFKSSGLHNHTPEADLPADFAIALERARIQIERRLKTHFPAIAAAVISLDVHGLLYSNRKKNEARDLWTAAAGITTRDRKDWDDHPDGGRKASGTFGRGTVYVVSAYQSDYSEVRGGRICGIASSKSAALRSVALTEFGFASLPYKSARCCEPLRSPLSWAIVMVSAQQLRIS